MIQQNIEIIEDELQDIPFVIWDRFAGNNKQVAMYGWIEREDQYKDFVVVLFDFYETEYTLSFITSSAKYTKQLNDVLCEGREHNPCKRAEHTFKNIQTVKLKDSKKGKS